MKRLLFACFITVAATSYAAYYSIYNTANGAVVSANHRGLLGTATEIVAVDGAPIMNPRLGSAGILKTTAPLSPVSPRGSRNVEYGEVSNLDGTLLTVPEAVAETAAIIDALKAGVWNIADAYGVTNSPLDWFVLDAAITAASESTNDVVAMQALRDGVRADKNAMFLKEWGVDLFNITR